eukprot:Rhum_TRINITY_DN14169_c21_g1::Rhum_TRINITY_DN14169_c21_g1_i1::g.72023::m.72023
MTVFGRRAGGRFFFFALLPAPPPLFFFACRTLVPNPLHKEADVGIGVVLVVRRGDGEGLEGDCEQPLRHLLRRADPLRERRERVPPRLLALLRLLGGRHFGPVPDVQHLVVLLVLDEHTRRLRLVVAEHVEVFVVEGLVRVLVHDAPVPEPLLHEQLRELHLLADQARRGAAEPAAADVAQSQHVRLAAAALVVGGRTGAPVAARHAAGGEGFAESAHELALGVAGGGAEAELAPHLRQVLALLPFFLLHNRHAVRPPMLPSVRVPRDVRCTRPCERLAALVALRAQPQRRLRLTRALLRAATGPTSAPTAAATTSAASSSCRVFEDAAAVEDKVAGAAVEEQVACFDPSAGELRGGGVAVAGGVAREGEQGKHKHLC